MNITTKLQEHLRNAFEDYGNEIFLDSAKALYTQNARITELEAQLADTKQVANDCRIVADGAIAEAKKYQWQPIETAPKDYVTEFDGWNGERVPSVNWAHPEYSPKGHFAWCVSEYIAHHGHDNVEVKGLTHWMPLPTAPAIAEWKA